MCHLADMTTGDACQTLIGRMGSAPTEVRDLVPAPRRDCLNRAVSERMPRKCCRLRFQEAGATRFPIAYRKVTTEGSNPLKIEPNGDTNLEERDAIGLGGL